MHRCFMDKRILLLGILLQILALVAVPVVADSDSAVNFQVKPDRCIALRQGQICYQKLTFSWSPQSQEEEICLFEKGSDTPIHCWLGQSLTQFKHEFESNTEITYQLQRKSSRAILGEATVNVAWVYKNSKKVSTGWRLF
ncbi:hypothetical protein TDB9533_03115 [Thalassocella blandensis]|nr:hypothetical protein TDB9533_03115 [Thalassocella blandensis]